MDVGKIGYSMVWVSAFVLDVDIQVSKEDDTVIGAVGKISYSMVSCSAFVLRDCLEFLVRGGGGPFWEKCP